jgi:protease IV
MMRTFATRSFPAALLLVALLLCAACIKPKITLFPDGTDPLEEFTLEGSGKEKVLLVPVRGFISDNPRNLPFSRRRSTVQEVVSHLKKAEEDKDVKAVILKVDSPGGSVTASDILYHEIMGYKERSGAKLVALAMGVAASGGYYISLPADTIIAHPTSIIGSIGVVFLRPNVGGLLEKIGVEVQVDKSGKNKDMGSPFRKATPEEEQMLQSLIDEMAARFLSLVGSHRKTVEVADVASARIYGTAEAMRLGLVDRIGYVDDAIREAKTLAGLSEDAKVVVYRRTEFPDDNVYNTSTARPDTPEFNLIDLGDAVPPLRSGFYYLWLSNPPR